MYAEVPADRYSGDICVRNPVGALSTIAEKSQENSIIFLGALGTFKGTVEPVPEPATWLLGTAGVLVLAVFRHRARRA